MNHNLNLTEIKKHKMLPPAIYVYKTKSIQKPFNAIVLRCSGKSVLKSILFTYEAEIRLHLLFETCSH